MADEITVRIWDDNTQAWVPLEVIMAERAAAKAQRQYLMTRVYVCDREGEQEPREVAGLEISADDWDCIAVALRDGDRLFGNESTLAHRALAKDISEEILAKLPEGVA